MTIAEALPIIEENKGQFRDKGINLFCSIDIYLYGGGCFPIFRLVKAVYGSWGVGHSVEYIIIEGLTGSQQCDDDCTDEEYGKFIGAYGKGPEPLMYYYVSSASGTTEIHSDFTLYSKSNVKFVNSTTDYSHILCPCEELNQDDALKVNNVHEGVGGHVN
jgi:hypothetical protein